jgi:hypothetical protein
MARPHIEHIHRDEVAPGALPAESWPAGVLARVLSRDAGSGALTAILHLPPGWYRPAGRSPVDIDLFVLAGTLQVGAALRGFGYYEYAPTGSAQEEWRAGDEGAEVMIFSPRGAPDFVPGSGSGLAAGRLEIDSTRLQWASTVIPGPPPGMFIKLLRYVEASGEGLFLASTVPHYDYPKIEYHDCVEEAYMVDGDIRLGNSGLMSKGRYFWRPPYIAHGPFFSTTGMLALISIDSPLINHFVDDPRRTIEENRAEALAQGRPVDYMGELAQ